MGHPESIRIEIVRITLDFRPPETGLHPDRKPRAPVPLIDRAFRGWDDYFDNEDAFIEDDIYGTLFTQ